MGIHNEAVRRLNAVKQPSGRGRRQRGTTVSPIDVIPHRVLLADGTNAFQVVDNAKIGGARRAGDGKQARSIGLA